MRQIPNGRVYTKEEFREEQKLWSKNDPYKNYEPSQDFITITNDREIFEGVYVSNRTGLVDRIHQIVMADLAGPDIPGGTDMTEDEKRGYYCRFRLAILKANTISNYFAEYIEEDKNPDTIG